ncbi:hypothetical protein [Flaviaesturariibacter terrae]
MRPISTRAIFYASVFLLGCQEATKKQPQHAAQSDTHRKAASRPPQLPDSGALHVSAYLLYNDSSTSAFNVLNNDTIALWNTIIGAGDAGKPSDRVKLVFSGKLDGMAATIQNGKRKLIHKNLPEGRHYYELILDDTGCDEVVLRVTKSGHTAFTGTIAFACGE